MPERIGEIRREHLSDVLNEFWQRAKEARSIVDRLMLLQEFAERHVFPTVKARKVRARHKRLREHRECWACRTPRAHVRHHVVQVQYGGTNDQDNLVALCHGCHAVVHPWLRKQPRKRRLPRE